MGEIAKEGERPAIPTNSLGLAICFYGAAADRSFASAQIAVVQNDTIDERARKNGVSARQIFEETKARTADPVQPVAGLGDDAFMSGRKIEVLKGTTYISISMMPKRLADPVTPASDAALKDVARRAVDRLAQ